MSRKGWHKESGRHSLAARGLKTRYNVSKEMGCKETAVKLKTPLYHGTRCDNLSSILRAGLSKECDSIHDESAWDAGKEYIDGKGKRLSDCGVYLTGNLLAAINYAYDATCDSDDEGRDYPDPDNACVLRVRCLGKDAKVGSDGFGDLMTDKDVPPECVEMVPKEEMAKAISVVNRSRIKNDDENDDDEPYSSKSWL